MKSADLNKWTGKVEVILIGAIHEFSGTELSLAEDFIYSVEDEVDEVSLPLIDQVWGETGARE
jgi:SpoU rRNA methylase family enzyme